MKAAFFILSIGIALLRCSADDSDLRKLRDDSFASEDANPIVPEKKIEPKIEKTSGNENKNPDEEQEEPLESENPDQCNRQRRLQFGISIDPRNPAAHPDPSVVQALGSRWLRIEFKVLANETLESASEYYKTLINKYRSAGIRVLLILDYATVPGRPPSSASYETWKPYLERYYQASESIAARFSNQVDAWQIWNEPDFPGRPDYDPGIAPQPYAEMLLETSRRIKMRSSQPVVTGGLASGNPGWFADVLRYAGGANKLVHIDGLAVHPYAKRPNNFVGDLADWGIPGDISMEELLKRYKAIYNKPIWITEIGTTEPRTEIRQLYIEGVYDLANEWGKAIPVVFWFGWADAMDHGFGVMDSAGREKPDFDYYSNEAPLWESSCDRI